MTDDSAMMPPPLPPRLPPAWPGSLQAQEPAMPPGDGSGRQSGLDPRRNAFRSDLAASHLAGRVDAPQFADGEARQVVRPSVPLRRRPAANAALDTEALFGETLVVYDIADGWAWVQLDRDGYVGYLPAETLSHDVLEPSHRVRSIGTFLYPVPDIKAPPLMHLSLNAQLSVAEGDDKFCLLTTGGFVYTRHITQIGRFVRDYVEVAEKLIDTPYLWGGRTRIGIDCSGLVQNALDAAGIACPRDSDMQEAEVGNPVQITAELDHLLRGDLLFWKGHVGMMVDGMMLLHANAHHMAVVVETLPEALQRIAKAGLQLRAIKRVTEALQWPDTSAEAASAPVGQEMMVPAFATLGRPLAFTPDTCPTEVDQRLGRA